jgi:hypothetical protein
MIIEKYFELLKKWHDWVYDRRTTARRILFIFGVIFPNFMLYTVTMYMIYTFHTKNFFMVLVKLMCIIQYVIMMILQMSEVKKQWEEL